VWFHSSTFGITFPSSVFVFLMSPASLHTSFKKRDNDHSE
jgi:hypothetical protein